MTLDGSKWSLMCWRAVNKLLTHWWGSWLIYDIKTKDEGTRMQKTICTTSQTSFDGIWKPTCLPVGCVLLEVFLHSRAIQTYIYLLTYLLLRVYLPVVKRLSTDRASSTRCKSTTFQRVCSTRRRWFSVPESRRCRPRALPVAAPFCRSKNIARAGSLRLRRPTCLSASRSMTTPTRSSRSLANH